MLGLGVVWLMMLCTMVEANDCSKLATPTARIKCQRRWKANHPSQSSPSHVKQIIKVAEPPKTPEPIIHSNDQTQKATNQSTNKVASTVDESSITHQVSSKSASQSQSNQLSEMEPPAVYRGEVTEVSEKSRLDTVVAQTDSTPAMQSKSSGESNSPKPFEKNNEPLHHQMASNQSMVMEEAVSEVFFTGSDRLSDAAVAFVPGSFNHE